MMLLIKSSKKNLVDNKSSIFLKIVVLVAIWWFSNVVSSIASKEALTNRSANKNVTITDSQPSRTSHWLELTTMQSGFGGILGFLWGKYYLKLKSPVQFSSGNSGKSMYIASFANTIGNSATNMAFSMIGSSSVQVVKSMEPIFTFTFAFFFFSKSRSDLSMLTLLSIITICLGSSMFLKEDHRSNLSGIAAAVTSNIGFSLRNIFLKSSENLDPLQKYTTLSIFSFAITFPVLIGKMIMDGRFMLVSYTSSISVFFHFVYNLASINVLQNVSPITHAVLNLCKRAVVVTVNIVHFSLTLSDKMIIGLAILLLGLIAFTYISKINRAQLTLTKKHNIVIVIMLLIILGTMYNSGIILKGMPQVNMRIYTAYPGDKVSVSAHLNGNPEDLRKIRIEKVDDQKEISNTGTPLKKANEEVHTAALKELYVPDYVFTFWLYTQPVPDSVLRNMENIAMKYKSSTFEIFCSSAECMKKFKAWQSENVKITFFELNKVIIATPFFEWMKKFILIKFLSGKYFEEYLKHMTRLSLLYRFGGLYIDPFYNVKDTSFPISKNLPWIASNKDVDFLDICYFPKQHDFVRSLSKHITVEASMLNSSKIWPVYYDMLNNSNVFYKNYKKSKDEIKETEVENIRKSTIVFTTLRHFATMTRRVPQGGVMRVNVGDEVQSFTGIQLLPYIDTFVDRGQLTLPKNYTQSTMMFFNAWWGEPNQLWPPNKLFASQLLSMHTQPTIHRQFIRNISYLLEREAVGARDPYSLRFFRSNKIESFFSACVTLLIKNRYEQKDRTSNVYVVDVLDKNLHLVPNSTNYKIISHFQDCTKCTRQKLLQYAYERIDMYAKAKLVVTQRIHAALPCVAMGTPVVFINSAKAPGGGGTASGPSERIAGLTELFHTFDFYGKAKPEEMSAAFNWHNPPPNPRVDLLMVYRARQWSYLRRDPIIYDNAIKFGIIPPLYVKQKLNKTALLNIHLFYDNKMNNEKLRLYHTRVIEAVLYHHPLSNLTIWSNSIDKSIFDPLTEVGFNITVQKYQLSELAEVADIRQVSEFIKGTSFEACAHLPLAKMLLLYKMGGLFIENDIILVKNLLDQPFNHFESFDGNFVTHMKFTKGNKKLKQIIIAYVESPNNTCTPKITVGTIPKENKNLEESSPIIRQIVHGKNETCVELQKDVLKKFKGIQIDFRKLHERLGDGKLSFRSTCKTIMNDYCLICYNQY